MSTLVFVPIAQEPQAETVLYALLAERPPEANISHREMPTWEQHCAFVRSKPYLHWYLIYNEGLGYVGSAYLTTQREVGIFIFAKHQGRGFGKAAIRALREKHPGPLLANISPKNKRSLHLFNDLGFRPVQHTYRID